MYQEVLKVFVACALGAGIGSLVALQASPEFWWIGLLVGGLVGYLGYDFKRVLNAIPIAFRATTPKVVEAWQETDRAVIEFFSKPRAFFYLYMFGGGIITTLCWWWTLPMVPTMIVLLLFWMFHCVLIAPIENTVELSIKWEQRLGMKPLSLEYLGFNPLFPISWRNLAALYRDALWEWGAAIAFVISLFVIRALPHAPKSCGKFLWILFTLIHSDIRLLCGVDAFLGALVGYASGSVLIGAMAGGALGVANYALVTERWLRPAGYLSARS